VIKFRIVSLIILQREVQSPMPTKDETVLSLRIVIVI
jgi:hypothetical protein